jgi:hypothetical protein
VLALRRLPSGLCGPFMHDLASELRRISLPRTRLNKGKRDRNEAPCHSRDGINP